MPYLGIGLIVGICILVGLVAFGRIGPKWYPYILFGIAATMVLMVTLTGPYLVGSDIHLEYYYAQLRAGRDVMPPTIGTPQGSTLLPYLTDNLWVWKVVYPLIFCLVPVGLYFIFRKWLDPTKAFLAAFFFISFPAFFMEVPGIGRQMISEVFLVGLMYLIVISGLRWRYKIPLVIGCAALIPMFHYSVGIVTIILVGTWILIGKNKRVALIALASLILISGAWFTQVDDGAVISKVALIYNKIMPIGPEIPVEPPIPQTFPREEMIEHSPLPGRPPDVSFFGRHEYILRLGLGFDFMETTHLGRIFRILHWIIGGLVIAGMWMWRRNKEYWVFASGALCLLGILILVPGFSAQLNITRFIHLLLFFLAPLTVVVLKPKYTLLVFIPYFLFASGLVFEIAKYDRIDKVTIPYNVGLSSHRMDLGASITHDDADVVRYIYENETYPVFADIVGADFLGSRLGWSLEPKHAALFRQTFTASEMYVLVRSRNVEDGTFVIWNGIGCRKYTPPEAYGINWDENIIYQKGDTRLIWVP